MISTGRSKTLEKKAVLKAKWKKPSKTGPGGNVRQMPREFARRSRVAWVTRSMTGPSPSRLSFIT